MTNRPLSILAVLAATVVGSSVPTVLAQYDLRVIQGSELLLDHPEVVFIQPRWSPDGTRLAITTESYNGIWIVNENGEALSQLTDESAAGFGLSWSHDGSGILARVSKYTGRRRSDAVKIFELGTAVPQQLTEYRNHLPALPRWSRDGTHVVVANENRVEVLVARPGSGKSVSSEPVVVVRGDRISAANPANETLVDLEGTPPGQPLNVEPSPDGRRVAFEVLGGSLFVISIDGTAPVDLGIGHRPQWSPDSEWVVFMKTEDDGHVTTASDLFAARADGSSMVRLTASPDALEMNPSWSPDGTRIAFDNRGAVYVMRVSY